MKGYTREQIRIVTRDGARLALHRYAPSAPEPVREPVLLIPGFGLNRYALDLNERYSWARALARHGFDAWILELRGSGESRFAGRSDGSFDDYLVDARAAMTRVLEATGAARLHWVGYSLGGMLLYAFLGASGGEGKADRVRSGVAVESPVDLQGYPVSRSSRALLGALRFTTVPRRIPYRSLTRLAMPVLPWFYDRPLFSHWMNPSNVDRALLPEILRQSIDDVPVALARQFACWCEDGRWLSVDGRVNYLQGLEETCVPLLVMTGRSEFSARARPVVELLRNAGSRWIQCLEDSGFSTDYGHADLIFGRKAPDEVFPHVLHWLMRHDPANAGRVTGQLSGENLATT